MLNESKQMKKVIKFYQLLPDELSNKGVEQLVNQSSINRESRRRLSKKTLNEKIKEIIISPDLRKSYADKVYNVIRESVDLELKNANYDEIMSAITDENKYNICIFFFRWCYENDANGESNDKKYFARFIESEIFDCILNGKSIRKVEGNVEESIEKIDDKLSEGGNNMKLLGRIEKRNTFYNFFPQFELINNHFDEISAERLKNEYPSNGGINLSYDLYSGHAVDYLNEISVDLDEDLYTNNVYVIEVDSYYLQENDNNTYRVKLDLESLIQDGKRLHNLIQSANEYKIYKIVKSDESNLTQKVFSSGNIIISEKNVTDGEYVVLDYKNKYYGPFRICYRKIDGEYYINTKASENNYLIPFFSQESVETIEFEKQDNYRDPTYTKFIYVNHTKSSYDDVIADEMLLEKITENISINLAITNPEEFSHACNNSPFLAQLPQDIISKRIDRLLKLITNTDTFEKKKFEVFESLRQMYQDGRSKESEKMITETETYKELQAKFNAERRKNEDLEKQEQEQKKNIEELNAQIEDMRKNSISTISLEKFSELEEENRQLKKRIDEIKPVSDAQCDIKELQNEQKKLEGTIDYLHEKENKYKQNIKGLKEQIESVIGDVGSKRMAELAFEPFISSEMMKQAAQWDSKDKEEEYRCLQNKLTSINASTLCDKDLVDYIVDFVKSRREYSRNDIINIYISIAQNFLTIFSGEPGTGKTSMCNIVADTLGLLNYGEEINRFVSVSVERGWSSKRDFIGYYNPLTRKYDKSNSKIYDALRMLNIERKDSKYPFLIMLDEANLSPIEYYWADFMRLTDRTSKNDDYINVGTEQELYIPETLRFVATINTDQTTEALSPRLIDRSCIIKLPNVELKEFDSHISPEIITWDNFKKTFLKTAELNPITQKAIKEIYKLFSDFGMSISPRIQKNIKKYIMTAQEIMEDETNTLAREKALDFAIVQKLLPKINGDYSLYEKFFDTLKLLCKEYNLHMTDDAISKIIEAQARNMGYCQYLI